MMDLAIEKPTADTRVVVAMSGGVDSGVTAALLVEAGFDVIGVTLRLYDHGEAIGRPGTCCAGRDIEDARRTCEHLGIPHYVLDYEERFRRQVIDDFADSYLAGETPIPCVRCNQRVKFGDLLDTARQLGADALATGHYARWSRTDEGPGLFRAADAARDQSYFLFATTREQLAVLRFPLGDLSKDETRALAGRFGLAIAAKADSQDICFVPRGRYSDTLARLRPDRQRPGDIVDAAGTVLGRHDGIAGFTVGQRRGLGIANEAPLYVLALDPATARVVVGPRQALARQRFRLREVNWLGRTLPRGTAVDCLVKLRSAMPPVAARLVLDGEDGAEVTLAMPYAGVAPGQACVCYAGDRLLGGGWICRDPGDHARTG